MKSQFEKDLDIKDSFIEMLDELYPKYKIGNLTFTASEILECCDPVAFRIGLSEHENYLKETEN